MLLCFCGRTGSIRHEQGLKPDAPADRPPINKGQPAHCGCPLFFHPSWLLSMYSRGLRSGDGLVFQDFLCVKTDPIFSRERLTTRAPKPSYSPPCYRLSASKRVGRACSDLTAGTMRCAMKPKCSAVAQRTCAAPCPLQSRGRLRVSCSTLESQPPGASGWPRNVATRSPRVTSHYPR